MTDEESERRPYASPANIIAVIKRGQTRNLPDQIDADFLRLADVGDNVHGRVLDALRFLRLVEPSGRPTEQFEALAKAGQDQYEEILAGIVREAYGEDFERVDPAQDTQAKLINAFQVYKPRSQTSRMVIFFLGICREAGIPVLEAPRERKMAGLVSSGKAKPGPKKSKKRRDGESGGAGDPHPPDIPDGLMFGVTDHDIYVLEEDESIEVFEAMRKVARARARAKYAVPNEMSSAANQAAEDDPDSEVDRG